MRANKIYVMCPSFSVTGGPEATHQLVHTLRRLGHDAYLYFLPVFPDPTLLAYAEYDFRYTKKVEDDEHNLLIALETMTSELDKFTRIKKAVWWLSVDNVYKLPASKQFDWNRPDAMAIQHFAQSQYAYEFLRRKGVEQPRMLTDYLRAIHLEHKAGVTKRDQIAYFEKKNAGAIEEIIAAAPELRWVAIKNMTPQQVSATLAESKVYLDLGPHPGRDRMPREAAMQRCCIVIGSRGAASYSGDYPFPDRYKFKQPVMDIKFMIETLQTCIGEYESVQQEFQTYRDRIRAQHSQFELEVKEIWGGTLGKEPMRLLVMARNWFIFYSDKVLKKLSGYTYPDEE